MAATSSPDEQRRPFIVFAGNGGNTVRRAFERRHEHWCDVVLEDDDEVNLQAQLTSGAAAQEFNLKCARALCRCHLGIQTSSNKPTPMCCAALPPVIGVRPSSGVICS